jgi:hypothetical protein
MPSEERSTWISLIATLMVNAWFAAQVWAMYHDGTAQAPDGLQTWAQTMLWVIPASILTHIALHILTAVILTATQGEAAARSLKDERDLAFENHGRGAMVLCVVVGILSAMIALAWGVAPFHAFNLIYLFFFLGDLANSGVRLALYRFA